MIKIEKIKKLIGVLFGNLPFLLSIAGVASIVFASFLLTKVLGYVVLGLALILIAYVITPQAR